MPFDHERLDVYQIALSRALPAAIQQMCEVFMERVEQLDPDAADARKAWRQP